MDPTSSKKIETIRWRPWHDLSLVQDQWDFVSFNDVGTLENIVLCQARLVPIYSRLTALYALLFDTES